MKLDFTLVLDVINGSLPGVPTVNPTSEALPIGPYSEFPLAKLLVARALTYL